MYKGESLSCHLVFLVELRRDEEALLLHGHRIVDSAFGTLKKYFISNFINIVLI